jgi:hypothetical protein
MIPLAFYVMKKFRYCADESMLVSLMNAYFIKVIYLSNEWLIHLMSLYKNY